MRLLIWVKLTAYFVYAVDAVTRTPCKRTARFEEPKKGYSLDNNVLATVNVDNVANCIINCLEHPECQSINYHIPANPDHVCELNSKTENDVTLTAKSDVIYYGPTLSKEPNCTANGPGECQNGGQCDMSCSGDEKLMCHCPLGRTGPLCEDEVVPYKGQGFSMVFPGTPDSYIQEDNVPQMSNITVLFWIRTLEKLRLMSLLTYTKSTSNSEFKVILRKSGNIELVVQSDFNNKRNVHVPPINDGYWHHVGITWSLGKYAIYLDGIEVESGDGFGVATPLISGGRIYLGQHDRFYPEKSFNGTLSQFNVWNKILTAAEIKSSSKSCLNNVGTILDWSRVTDKIHGNIQKEQVNSCIQLRRNANYDIVMSATPTESTQATHIVSSDNIPSLSAFTISMWAKHSEYIRYVEYTNDGSTLLKFRLHKDVLILEVGVSTKQARVPRYWKESPAYWHHISTTWSSNTAHWKIYLDGSLVTIMHDVASGHTIPGGGQLLLGLGNPSNGDHSMDGSLSRLNIWDCEIDGHVLSLMANKGPLFENGNVFAWYGVKSKAVGDMNFEETPSDLYNSRELADYQLTISEASSLNYGVLHDVFPNDITTVSACFWANFFKYSAGVFSYCKEYDEEFMVYLYSDYSMDLLVRDYNVNVPPAVQTNRWHFHCVQWRSSDGLVNIYKDGVNIYTTTKKMGDVIPANGAMIIAQEPDSCVGGFSSSQAMAGELAGLNFWSDFLTANEVAGMASGVINVNGNLLQWRQFRNAIHGDVTIEENPVCTLPEYRVEKLRHDYCETKYPGTYPRFVRNKDTSYAWRCIRPSAMLDENMVYNIEGYSPSYFSRSAELWDIQ